MILHPLLTPGASSSASSLRIVYTRTNEVPESQYRRALQLLPPELQMRNGKFRRAADRMAHLYGKLLLLRALSSMGINDALLEQLSYNEYNRPGLPGVCDFNISHSGSLVICAVSNDTRLGIDLEEIHPVDFNEFNTVMSGDEWEEIKNADDPTREFFRYWTRKESMIKADGRGLSIPLTEINAKNETILHEGHSWHLHDLQIDPAYSACLATERALDNNMFVLEYISFD